MFTTGTHSKKYKKEERDDFNSWNSNLAKMEGIRVRRERSSISVFCRDRDTADKLSGSHRWILELWEPASAEEAEFLKNSSRRKRVCKRYPRGKYQYKMFIKSDLSIDQKNSLMDWFLKYPEVLIPNAMNRYLTSTRYPPEPHIYIKDEKTASIFFMFLGDKIKHVEQYILRETLTPAEQESVVVEDDIEEVNEIEDEVQNS